MSLNGHKNRYLIVDKIIGLLMCSSIVVNLCSYIRDTETNVCSIHRVFE